MTEMSQFNPAMLSLARKTRQRTRTQVANFLGVSVPTVSKYESGAKPMPDERVKEVAAALDYPVGFFYRREPLIGSGPALLYHRKQQSVSAKKLHEVHALAEVRRLEINSMLESLDVSLPVPYFYDVEEYGDEPEKIARSVRAAMNIPPGPIFNLTEVIERNGYVVVVHDFGSRQIDGFSQRPYCPPCFIHLNSELPPDRWRWTLAHELGHLVMHFDPMQEPKLVERQADLFAGEFLTPANEIGPQLAGLSFHKLAGLKIEWQVSMQSLINRAYHLRTISASQRKSMFVSLSRAGYRTREPEDLDPPVERPTMMMELAQRHMDELEYSRSELCEFIAIGEAEFKKHYIESDDILTTLGIDDILRK